MLKQHNEFSRLSARTKDRIELLINSPLITEIQRAREAELLEERAQLVQKNRDLPAMHEKANAAAAADARAAEKRWKAAKAEYEAATEDHLRKVQAANGLLFGTGEAIAAVHRRLLETCDARVWTFIAYLDRIDDNVRHRAGSEIWHVGPNTTGKHHEIRSNLAAVDRVRSVIKAARDRVDALKFTTATREDVTRGLQAIAAALTPELAKFEMLAPNVFDESIKAPQKWDTRHIRHTEEELQ